MNLDSLRQHFLFYSFLLEMGKRDFALPAISLLRRFWFWCGTGNQLFQQEFNGLPIMALDPIPDLPQVSLLARLQQKFMLQDRPLHAQGIKGQVLKPARSLVCIRKNTVQLSIVKALGDLVMEPGV